MADDAPNTGAPVRARAFNDFDLSRFDHVEAGMSVLKSLIWVSIDLLDSSPKTHADNLLHAALDQFTQADNLITAIHSDLRAIRHGMRTAEATHA